MNLNCQNGFVALFSVIIISFVLILVATTLSFTGYFTRFDILDSESKKRSESLADACTEQARLEIALDSSYTINNKSLLVNNDYCDYSVTSGSTIIISHSEVNNAHTYYWAKVNKNDSNIPIIDFKECTTYNYSLNPINCLSP